MPEAQDQREQSRTVPPGPLGASVVRAFEDRAAEGPASVAVRFETALLAEGLPTEATLARARLSGTTPSGATLTYAELNKLANALAHRLIDLGVAPGTPVALCLDPSPLTAIAILGVLKAGGAYVPVSSADPIERIAYVLHDTAAPVLLTEERLLPELRRLAPHPIALDELVGALRVAPDSVDRDDDAGQAPGNPDRAFDPRQTAYILYTSGSSGNPKGVMVPHESLAYYLRWHLEHLRPAIGHLDLPLSSSTCFAAGVTQFYTPLMLGRTLHIFPHGAVRDSERVFAWYREHPDYGLYCVPTLWNELVKVAERQRVQGQPVVGPRGVLLSGEAVDQKLIDRSADVWPAIHLWNLYGPTEATANATAGELRPGLASTASVTIGTPIVGTRVYLVDEAMQEVPPGEIGELCICGPGVASGYVNLPDLTAQRFIANPFDPSDTSRLFRTGDLARVTDGGGLLFLGRRDFQVKIRGYRIECAEIEHALLQHPAIRQAVVVCRDQELVAYLTFHFARYVSVDEVRASLASRVPEYMMPAAFVMLDALPMLANGKVDRKRLPAPGAQRPALAYDFEPPRTTRERQLVRVWEAALGVEGVGVQDNFFDLGGDSLKVAAALARIRETLHASVSYRDLFDHPTPAALAAILSTHAATAQAASSANASASSRSAHTGPGPGDSAHGARPESPAIGSEPFAPDLTPIEALPARAAYPCADNQHSLWMLAQTWPGLSAYNIRFSVRFDGDLDRDALTHSVGTIVQRHDALRTVFRLDDGGPVARVIPFAELSELAIPVVDLRHLEPSAREAELERLAAADSERPFSLDAGPLFRCTLFRLADDRHHLSVIVHHIVFDGRSIGVFCRELIDGYGRARRQPAQAAAPLVPATPALPLQYQDWVVWQRRHVRAHGADLASFWTRHLDGSSFVLGFPTDYARPPRRSFNGAVRKVRIGEAAKQRLASFNQRERATSFMTLLALFNLLLYRYSDQEDILVGCPVANRQHPELEGLLGYFTNTIVVRTSLAKDRSFRALLSAVRDACVQAFDRQSLPFEQVVQALRPDRRLSHTPVFQVMFAYHEKLLHGRVDDRLTARAYEDGNRGAKFDLALDVQDLGDGLEDGGLELKLTYSTDLFADATAARCLDHYVRLLEAVVDDPALELASYSLMSVADLDTIGSWSRGRVDPSIESAGTPLHQLFEAQAARTPAHLALIAGDDHLTYARLDERANRLARHLVEHGVEPGARVGVHVEPSADMIVALLAVLKTGAAYVPLDPYYPRDRLSYIIEDCGARAIVTQPHLRGLLTDCPSTVRIVDAGGSPSDMSGAGVKSAIGELMYVMYTSGSTGRPKGVMVPHRGATNYVRWMQDAFPLTPDDRVLGKTSINFDISVWEIFLPLIAGATLVVAGRDELQAPDSLAALIQRERVTQIQFVPSALRAFVDSGRLSDCRSLARIFSGGEALPAKLQADVFAASGAELHNLYGPTEASIYACHWECRRNERRRSVPIGRPIPNLRTHILDAQRQPVPIGLPGELYLGGVGVAHGYWNRPELTEAAFVPDPWSPDPNARLFKTGDVARYWSDGAIEFLGRSDRQVKVRGYRIELDEIEHHLATHPQVKHAIIIVREDEADDVRLVAYMLYRDKHGPTTTELREYLKQKLPDYMVPSTFVALDSVPLLPNDKANMRALPKPSYTKSLDADLTRRYDTDCERELATIWEDVLGTEKFGPEDNFFDVGGHSLLMSKLGLLIEQRLQIAISNIDLFQFPTIRSLARHVTQSRGEASPLAPAGPGPRDGGSAGDARGEANRRIAADMARRAALARRRTKAAGAGTDRVM